MIKISPNRKETATITHNFHYNTYPIYSIRFWLCLPIIIKSNAKECHTSVTVNGHYYEALVLKGVVKKPIKTSELSSEPAYSISFQVPINKKYHMYTEFLDRQVGKGYDYFSVLFGFFSKPIDAVNRWWCSELNNIFFEFYAKDERMKTNQTPKDVAIRARAFKRGLETLSIK